MSKKISFKAEPGTEVGTGVGGENVVIKFGKDGFYETDNIGIIDILTQLDGIKSADSAPTTSKADKDGN